MFLDPDAIAVAMNLAEIRSSGVASVQLDSASTQASATSVTATAVTSMFQTNSTAIIGEVCANWRVLKPEAVVVTSVQAFGL